MIVCLRGEFQNDFTTKRGWSPIQHICIKVTEYQLVYDVTAVLRDHRDVINRARSVGWYGKRKDTSSVRKS